jgi:lactate dehydrogenase-like 2-hydroxyacid dehydrogenase
MGLLEGVGYPVVVGESAPPSRERLLADVAGAVGAVVTITEKVDAEFLDAAGPGLKVVANVAVGYDNIDVAAAAERGVVVTNTPGVLDGATADHTFALILAMTRRVVEADRFARSGEPWVWGPTEYLGLDISAGAVLGIVGLGRIGKAVARRAQGFGMRVVAFDTGYDLGAVVDGTAIVTWDELLASSDVLSLHVPLLPATRHLIGEAELAKMKPGSYLVNAARGGVVDELALAAALISGHLAGAALDVFEGEPVIRPVLRAIPNVILTPHIASAGEHTRDVMGKLALDNVLAVLDGRPALTPVG